MPCDLHVEAEPESAALAPTQPEPSAELKEMALANEVMNKTSKIQLLEEQKGKLEQQLAEARAQGETWKKVGMDAADAHDETERRDKAEGQIMRDALKNLIQAAQRVLNSGIDTSPSREYEAKEMLQSAITEARKALREPRAGRDLEGK